MSNESKTLKIFCFATVAALLVSAVLGVIFCLDSNALKGVAISTFGRVADLGMLSMIAGFMLIVTAVAEVQVVFEGIRLANTPRTDSKTRGAAVMVVIMAAITAILVFAAAQMSPLNVPFAVCLVDIALGLLVYSKASQVQRQAER